MGQNSGVGRWCLMLYPEWTALRRLMFVKAASGETLVEQTATGNPVTFETNVSKPLKSLTIPWTPTQSGTGDPSPDNVRPISGITGLTIYHSGADTSNPTSYPVTFPAEAGTVYGGTLDAVSGVLEVWWNSFDLGTLRWDVKNNGNVYYFNGILPSSIYNNMRRPDAEISLNTYPPYFMSDRFKIASGSSIHSGTSGDNAIGMDWFTQVRLRCDAYEHDADAFKTAMNGVILYYELATPQTIQLDPITIQTIIGDNTVWSDTNGTNEVKYLKKG